MCNMSVNKLTCLTLKHKYQILNHCFVFQIYTGCYNGSVQAVKLNLMQNYRCRVR